MNSESAKELLKWRNSVLVCRHGKRKGMRFRFSYFFRGEVFHDSCAGHFPSNLEKRHVRLFGHARLIGQIRYYLSISRGEEGD